MAVSSQFSDAELAAGLEEIRRTYQADTNGNIAFTEQIVILKATKPL